MLRLSTSVSYQIISSTHSLFLRHSFNISQKVIIFSSEKSYTQKLFNQEAENIVIAENNWKQQNPHNSCWNLHTHIL